MNIHARRRTVNIGLAYLAEAVADVLQEAQDNNEGGLTAATVRERSGLPDNSYAWDTCRFVLNRLEQDGVVINNSPSPNPGSWRLAE